MKKKPNFLAYLTHIFLRENDPCIVLLQHCFYTKATPKLTNKIAPNMSTISKKEKEALGKNQITLSFEVGGKHTIKYVCSIFMFVRNFVT